MKHGVPRNCMCRWCGRSFGDALAVNNHERDIHFVRTDEDRAWGKFKAYHQDRVAKSRKEKRECKAQS